MPRIQLTDLPVDETLDAQALAQVRGGIIAVLIGFQQKLGPHVTPGIKSQTLPSALGAVFPYIEQDNLYR